MRARIRTAISRHLHSTRPDHMQILFENRPLRLRAGTASWLHLQLDGQPDEAGLSVLGPPVLAGRVLACLAVAAGQGTDQLDSDTDWLTTALSWRYFGPVCLGGLRAASVPVPARLSGPGLYTACFAAPLLPLSRRQS